MQPYLLPIHFEILDGKHEVNSVTLNTFIEAYKEIFEGFFETKIEIQIGLPEEGGWQSYTVLRFAAGLLIYWTWSNTLSILQQWVITNKLNHEVKK